MAVAYLNHGKTEADRQKDDAQIRKVVTATLRDIARQSNAPDQDTAV